MRVGLIDIAAAGAILVAILLPEPASKLTSVYEEAHAQKLQPAIAAAQADALANPASGVAAQRLADLLSDAGESDWAIRLAAPVATEGGPDRWRAAMAVAMVHADRLEIKAAHEWAEKAVVACVAAQDAGAKGPDGCPAHERIRLEIYADALKAGVDSGIDPAVDPKGFAAAIQRKVPTMRLGPPREPAPEKK